MAAVFSSIDLTGIATFVAAAAAVAVTVALTFKGVSLGKRGVRSI